jgi:lipopolysaccharide export system protein LptC
VWFAQARKWLPTAGLIIVAVATTWMVRQFEQPPAPERVDRVEDPDYFVENFTTTTTDETGAVVRRISAERLLHFPDTDTNELEKPHLILYHPTRTPWHIEAERGWLSASNEVVLLLGRVHAWRDDDVGARAIDIRTRDLRILPNTEYGETDQPVVIRTKHTETRGIAMRAYLNESRLELLARVTTTYTPAVKK